MKKLLLPLLTAVMLTGCITSTVEPTREYKPMSKFSEKGNMVVADISGTNYTSYLFGLFPIVGGRWTFPNAWQYNMWENTVSPRKTRFMMNWYATKVMKADGIENLKITTDTIGWPTLWIVSWRIVHASAQVIKKHNATAQ